jgi:trimeric autotransporter adhesin
MKINASVLCASLFLTLAAGAGCTGNTTNTVDEGKTIASVNVAPSTDTMRTGASVQFTATLEYADGGRRDVTTDRGTVWNTSDPSIATVSPTGMVTTIKVGIVEISAKFGTVKGDQRFAVTP